MQRLRARRRAGLTPTTNKTTAMLLKEVEYNLDITTILRSGPLHHNNRPASPTCHCLSCAFNIKPSTASKWRKRLGIPPYEGD